MIIATDCDREGENIAWSIINQTKINKANKIFKRLWINSLEKEVIKKVFRIYKMIPSTTIIILKQKLERKVIG